ncbi:hypothetical protein PFISCL1PPCAC_18564 [Pristionchus fissidentatus]|uniref:L-Fucosyltransferase n=1 Tax=Pristionchus fissidentatus TaxID=1538716 RepID=A0AAV5WB78_9BILA|nr:hypothetical protein PFISCL1PPCAC_18564 [Pristionchus fissidentatus]
MYGSEPFLLVDLYSLNDESTRVGNHVFELLGSIALARKLNRTLLVHTTAAERIHRENGELLNIWPDMNLIFSSEVMPFVTVFDYFNFDCCRFNPGISELNDCPDSVILVKLKYIQSYKYVQSLELTEIRHLLAMNETMTRIARENLIPPEKLAQSDHKLCVHSRRGDFLHTYVQAYSTTDFTLPAIQFVLNQLNSSVERPLVIMIGDDLEWQKEITQLLKKSSIESMLLPRSKETNSPLVDWQFSEMYCDTVLITGSASTFGWWLAHVSKGQKVYYNSVYQKGNRFGDMFHPEDFFPPYWISLTLESSQLIQRLPANFEG